MPSLIDLTLEGRKVGQHRPWPRVAVDASVWTFAASELAHGRWSLLGLWGEPATVHMAIMDGTTAEIAVVSLDCPDRIFPSVGKHHPPALRLERTINDLFGLSAQGSPDARPWLDHNRWGVRYPLGDRIVGDRIDGRAQAIQHVCNRHCDGISHGLKRDCKGRHFEIWIGGTNRFANDGHAYKCSQACKNQKKIIRQSALSPPTKFASIHSLSIAHNPMWDAVISNIATFKRAHYPLVLEPARGFSLCDSSLQTPDILRQVLAGQHEKYLRILKVDFEQPHHRL